MDVSVSYSNVPTLTENLRAQILAIADRLKIALDSAKLGSAAVLLTGSCSRGQATYRSDIDLLVISDEKPAFSKVQAWRDAFEVALGIWAKSPLPVQVNFVDRTVFDSSEPAMCSSLKSAIVLYDPENTATEKLERLRQKR